MERNGLQESKQACNRKYTLKGMSWCWPFAEGAGGCEFGATSDCSTNWWEKNLRRDGLFKQSLNSVREKFFRERGRKMGQKVKHSLPT